MVDVAPEDALVADEAFRDRVIGVGLQLDELVVLDLGEHPTGRLAHPAKRTFGDHAFPSGVYRRPILARDPLQRLRQRLQRFDLHALDGRARTVTRRDQRALETVLGRFPQPLLAFGADFADVNEGGLLDVRFASASAFVPNGSTFFGIVSDIPFRTVELRTAPTVAEEFYRIDNVSYVAIPEPGSSLLALLALLVLSRRSRTNPV